MIIITPPIYHKVEKTQVSAKDTHHAVDKDKKEKKEAETTDKIELSEEVKEERTSQRARELPDNPLQGHIDIDV